MAPPTHERGEKLTIGVLYGFRALMVLFVCNYHIWQQTWLTQAITIGGEWWSFDPFTRSSFLFVDGMLLLSGFLLYLPYARQTVERMPVPSVGRFYANRLIRILPSYVVAILIALFCFALPMGAYRDTASMNRDVLAHLSFTFPFWQETYLYTPLNGALWTIAIEMQFYLLFPLLARAAQKRPALTLSAMTAAGFVYRGIVHTRVADTAMWINQMPSFLDVYALGMLGAMLFVRLRPLLKEKSTGQWLRVMAVPLFFAACWLIWTLLGVQSENGLAGHEALRLSQLRIRFPFALCMLVAMLAATMLPRLLQRLLDNRLMRFFSTISLNLYIWHQVLSARMVADWFPDTLRSTPALQWACTALCFSVSILVAMAATYGLEQPAGRLMNQWISKYRRKKDHDGSSFAAAEPPTDSVLVRIGEGTEGADRELRSGDGICNGVDSGGV